MPPISINLSKIPYPEVRNAKKIGEFHDYLIKNGGFSTAKRGLRTENINSCTTGVLFGKEQNFMFHAAPEMQPLSSIKKELAKHLEKLQRTCDDIKGFICGGWALDNKDKETVMSFDLYNTIADALDSLGVKFTMICGKDKGAHMDNIYAIGNNATMWNGDFKKLLNDKNIKQEDVVELLEESYQFVENDAGLELKVIDNFSPKTQHLV